MIFADLPAATALGAVVLAAAIDARRFEIPDSLSVFVLVLAVIHGLVHPGFPWLWHVASVAAMFGFGLIAFARGWLGGGDVKLLTALAAWTGPAQLPLFFLAVSLAGGILALTLMAARRAATALPAAAVPRLLEPSAPLPYAVAVAAGTIWWAWATGGGGVI